MTNNEGMNYYKKIAKTVGALFVAGMVIGIAGHMLVQSIITAPDHLSNIPDNSMLLAFGAVLLLLTCAWDAAHGVLMFPILKKHNEGMAVGYLAFRIVDAVFLAISVLFVLLQSPLASEYVKAAATDTSGLQSLSALFVQGNLQAYNVAMIFLGVAGFILCTMFFRAKLVPRFVAIWGIVGYATILCGSVLEVLGFGLSSIHTLPGGLWELFIGVWLLTKGFSSTAKLSQDARTSTSVEARVPYMDPAKA